ncbi:MAG: hypothetical protein L6R38_009220 [Xanthoria sp. 2 TBL-2021]|nr:MAG: hypothetical protein L6R38_009220 [Xanthoria sp. 2 TBL-2021]
MATPTLDIYDHTTEPEPTLIDAFSTFNTDAASPTSLPPPTSAPEGGGGDRSNNNGILNYYFLLLALIIILLGILYLTFARRQRQRLALRRQNGQRALARDLERWGGGGPFGPGRFRMPRNSNGVRPSRPRTEEGLNESGEAPPPYIPKEPEPAHVGGSLQLGNSIPLHDLSTLDHKPPDYDEGPSSRHDGRGHFGTGPVMRGE